MSTEQEFKRVHFIGIGGAGMSGIAKVLHERGFIVTGSDLKRSLYVRTLENLGIQIFLGHAGSTIDTVMPDVVVISTAIPDANPELMRSYELGIAVWHRAKMLSWLSGAQTTVAVAGTHGKTTTSSMLASMLDGMGCDPSFLIGGIVEGYGTNGKNGNGKYFVCEADESDGSFLFINPTVAVVTNVEAEHMEHYHSMDALEAAFVRFMAKAGPEGTAVVCGDSDLLRTLAEKSGVRIVTYGLGEASDYRCVPDPETHTISRGCTCRRTKTGEEVHVVLSHNPGVHNLLNATAALAVAGALGLDLSEAAAALSEFKGARRRFTQVGTVAGITVVDDYGHHPTEIAATLKAASELGFNRIICVFQPHRYTRTRDLEKQFGHAFDHADVLRVTSVFAAGEMPIPGITGRTVVRSVEAAGQLSDVAFAPNRARLLDELCELLKPGDLVITQGAGDITMLGPDLIDRLEKRGG